MKPNCALMTIGIVMCLLMNGCSAVTAAKQPGRKPVELFEAGTPRHEIISAFGYPAESETRAGKRYEIFRFTQGYSKGARAGRAVLHGAADIMTLGLWEVMGQEVEEGASGSETVYGVLYDRDDHIENARLLRR